MPPSMPRDRFSRPRDGHRHVARSIFKVARCPQACRAIDFRDRAMAAGMSRDRFSRLRNAPGHRMRSIFKVAKYRQAVSSIYFKARELRDLDQERQPRLIAPDAHGFGNDARGVGECAEIGGAALEEEPVADVLDERPPRGAGGDGGEEEDAARRELRVGLREDNWRDGPGGSRRDRRPG